MMDGAGVAAGVTVRGRVAAERDTAGLAGAQVHPLGADLHAFFAFVPFRSADLGETRDVRAGVRHNAHSTMPSSPAADLWPELPYYAWKDTYATLHMWM